MSSSEYPENNATFLRWLIITFLLLACMAFFSALGGFFVRIFLVLSLFTGWRTYSLWRDFTPKDSGLEERFSRRDRESSDKRNVSANPDDSVFDQIKRWPIHLKIVRAIWAFIFLVLTIVFWTLVFSSRSIDTQAYLQSAKDYYDTDQYDSADSNFKKVLMADDENTEALFGYGNTLFERGFPDSSIYYYNRVLELDPNFYLAQYNKGWVYFQRKMYNESIVELNALVEDNPTYYAAYQLRGDCYYSLNQYDEALVNYETAYNNDWKSQWICHVIGYLYDAKNDVDKAISFYEESLQYDENNVEVLKRLGELLPGERGDSYRQRLANLSN